MTYEKRSFSPQRIVSLLFISVRLLLLGVVQILHTVEMLRNSVCALVDYVIMSSLLALSRCALKRKEDVADS